MGGFLKFFSSLLMKIHKRCQGTDALNPDLSPAETLVRLRRNTFRNLQHVVKKQVLIRFSSLRFYKL
ncbi:hypothetical protein D1AOALGA4SA_2487 [Olavius algarvensis Delta 1 endosymbiont]|nr:hypothetical protein D1AOALGA4SA_2487 [Olavius algarvensis Delta 1 endosymbiont]